MAFYLAINSVEIASYPAEFSVKVLDLDNAETTTRTADGKMARDRIAVKRQIEMSWPVIEWADLSAVMQAMQGEFFTFTYPDPMTGTQQTKTFYVGDRTAPVAIIKGDTTWWKGLQATLTEQ